MCKKLRPTVGGKAPWKEFLWAGQVKKPRRYQPGTVALCKIWQFQKSTELLIQKLPFSQLVCENAIQVGKYDMCFEGCAIIYLQKAAEVYIVGTHGRCKPLHHSCKKGYKYSQGHSVSLLHLGRASTLLKYSPEICFGISVGCKLCRVLTGTGVRKLEWDTQPGLYGILFM